MLFLLLSTYSTISYREGLKQVQRQQYNYNEISNVSTHTKKLILINNYHNLQINNKYINQSYFVTQQITYKKIKRRNNLRLFIFCTIFAINYDSI